MSALSEPCPSYEPHFWKMGKCKNCFFSRAEHKRYRKELQADDDASSAGDVSPHESADGDSSRLQLKRREARDEMKQLRKERKALASKHSELRDTMMTMEAQMLDYKETKQENDILTKDMKLLRKDLHEITAGAARACEQNELLRQEAAMLRLCLEENGMEAPETLLDARFQLQPESPYSSTAASRAGSPRAPDSRRETKKETPERAVPSLKLAGKGLEAGLQQPLSHSTRPIVQDIDRAFVELSQNCTDILQQCSEGQAVVSLNFVLGMLQALERQSAAALSVQGGTPSAAKKVSKESSVEPSKGVKKAANTKKEEKEQTKKESKKKAKGEDSKEDTVTSEGEKEGKREAKEEQTEGADGEATDGESSESRSKSRRVKKSSSKESKSRSKHGSVSPDVKRAAKVRPKKSIGGKLVAGLKKRASLSVPKLSACMGDASTVEDFAAYLEDQDLGEEARFLALYQATEAYAGLSSSSARVKAFRELCDAHVGDEGPPLAADLRSALLEAREALDEEEKAPAASLVERCAAAARARLEAPFRTFSLRGSS